MTLVLRKVRSICVWATDGWRALVDRREGSCTDLEVGKLVIGDFNGIPWVAVPSRHTLPGLRNEVSDVSWYYC